jgi:hypothetical protein
MLMTLKKVHVSCYGITKEENREITKTDYFDEFCRQMRRLLRIAEGSGLLEKIWIGFRLIYNHSSDEIADFQLQQFNRVLDLSSCTTEYFNWGNSMRGRLPGDARYTEARENTAMCAIAGFGITCFLGWKSFGVFMLRLRCH